MQRFEPAVQSSPFLEAFCEYAAYLKVFIARLYDASVRLCARLSEWSPVNKSVVFLRFRSEKLFLIAIAIPALSAIMAADEEMVRTELDNGQVLDLIRLPLKLLYIATVAL
jgi:hypothetical protein